MWCRVLCEWVGAMRARREMCTDDEGKKGSVNTNILYKSISIGIAWRRVDARAVSHCSHDK